MPNKSVYEDKVERELASEEDVMQHKPTYGLLVLTRKLGAELVFKSLSASWLKDVS